MADLSIIQERYDSLLEDAKGSRDAFALAEKELSHAKATFATAKATFRQEVGDYIRLCKVLDVEPEEGIGNILPSGGGHSSPAKTPMVRWNVYRENGVVHIGISGRNDTAEDVDVDEIRDVGTSRFATEYVARHLGDPKEVGKAGGLANRLRSLVG